MQSNIRKLFSNIAQLGRKNHIMTKKLTAEEKDERKEARAAKKATAKAAEANPIASFKMAKPDWTPSDERRMPHHLKMTPKEVFDSKVDFVNGHCYMQFGNTRDDYFGEFTVDGWNKEISVQAGRALALLQSGLWEVSYDYDGEGVAEGAYVLRNRTTNRLLVVYAEKTERGPIARVQEYHFGDKVILDEAHKNLEPYKGWKFHSIENATRIKALKNQPVRTGTDGKKSKDWVVVYTKYHLLAKMLAAQERGHVVDFCLEEFGEDQEAARAKIAEVYESGQPHAVEKITYWMQMMKEATGIRVIRYDQHSLQHGYTSELWISSGYKYEELTRARRTFA